MRPGKNFGRRAIRNSRKACSPSFKNSMKTKMIVRAAMASALFGSPIYALACATCGCSLSTDAATGYSSTSGWRISLEYDYINQDQLRTGSNAISPTQVAAINNAGGNQEVEHDTINRYTTLGLSYTANSNWSFRLLVPYIDRGHTTYSNATTSQITPDQISGATSTGIGDTKFITTFQGLLPTHSLGLQFGIKLPTGDYGGSNAEGTGTVGRNPVAFTTGPNSLIPSPGNLLDTSLNTGTGSTDLIVGAFYYQPVSQNFDAFINGQYQAAVSEKLDQTGEDYRPGNQATVSFGVRYEADPTFVPQLQVNITKKSSDQGALADTTDTAGTVAYLSPGATAKVTDKLQVYAFAQLPIYSKLDGYQLFPHWTATAGLSYAF
jgi:hypothetical protein